MKRYLFILLIVGIIFSTGCDIPVQKNSNDAVNGYAQDNTAESDGEIEGNGLQESETESAGEVKGVSTDTETKSKQEEKKLSLILYYQSGDGLIIPVTRKVIKQEGIAKAAVSGLIDSSVNREELEYYGLYPVLPLGTEIRGLTIKDGTAVIDFNSKLLEYNNKVDERNVIASIVYTLTEFKTIKGVKILIDGAEKGNLKYGTDLSGSLSRESVLVNSDKINLKQGMKKFDIYLLKDMENEYSYALPVSVECPESTEDMPAKIIEALAKGGKDKSMHTEIPQKTGLKGSSVNGKVLTLDFNSDLKSYGGGNAREEGLLKQVMYSMKQIDGVEKIKILIDGEEDSLPEGSDISGEIPLPAEINDYIDKQ